MYPVAVTNLTVTKGGTAHTGRRRSENDGSYFYNGLRGHRTHDPEATSGRFRTKAWDRLWLADESVQVRKAREREGRAQQRKRPETTMGIQLQKGDKRGRIIGGVVRLLLTHPLQASKPPGHKLGGFSFTEKAMYGKKPMKPAKKAPGKYGPKK